jgi:alpha-L-fucosidase 2
MSTPVKGSEQTALLAIWLVLLLFPVILFSQVSEKHDLRFTRIPDRWDEGIPLGNGLLGALIWQKDSMLRISLDRADLWDLRPVKEFDLPQFRFSWVYGQWKNNTYDTVQQLFDLPYERDPGPTKLPAGAVEIPVSGFGPVDFIRLHLDSALCEVRWKQGTILCVFIDASQPAGHFRFSGLKRDISILFDPPSYKADTTKGMAGSAGGQDLAQLGYPAPEYNLARNGSISFCQEIFDRKFYVACIRWDSLQGSAVTGSWTIILSDSVCPAGPASGDVPTFDSALVRHAAWWRSFWSKSAISIPDTVLENQYYMERYKFGSASRKGAVPVTLQAVWTADNGKLPPWKGDFHNDLNTQLSYWPGYAANHLEESSVFTDWIWANRQMARRYTEDYFGLPGLNFPGVSTLTGAPMGGWIQYALSPTVSAWLSHHFYLQWKYSMDEQFLVTRAYPFIRATALFLDSFLLDKGRYRQFPLSSSPEFFDNSRDAWFPEMTNYDIALTRWLFGTAAELAETLAAKELKKREISEQESKTANQPEVEAPDRGHSSVDNRGKNNADGDFMVSYPDYIQEAKRWKKVQGDLPPLILSESTTLMIADRFPYTSSHRHFSHLMALHPLGLIDGRKNRQQRKIFTASLADLRQQGPANWCGYSYAWYGNLLAWAGEGDSAAEALRIFATCFCLANSFHVNGDQSGTGKSGFTYRPFTLEGNFAFAAGIQEMLLQSQGNVIRIFPAIPVTWKDCSFRDLRAQGAFLVSAVQAGGAVQWLEIVAEKGGLFRLENPFMSKSVFMEGAGKVKITGNTFIINTLPGQKITFRHKQ